MKNYKSMPDGVLEQLFRLIKTKFDALSNLVTTSADGLMSSADKSKLDGIAEGATKYTHPTYTARSSGLYKITVDGSGHVSDVSSVSKSDITGLGIPSQDTTYEAATQTAAGLMSATDKSKLDKLPATGNVLATASVE